MDADTRHQLKHNELADILNKLRDLRDPRFLWTLAAVVVIVLAVLAWKVWQYSRAHVAEQAWSRLADIGMGLAADDANAVAGAMSNLRALIQETTDPAVVGYARLQLARARVQQGLTNPAERSAAFEEAVSLLAQIRSDPQKPPLLEAPAAFLLASTYESMREPERAKPLYQELADSAAFAGSPYQALAAERLATMDEATTVVMFTPGEPPPPPPPATQPTPIAPTITPTITPTTQPQVGVFRPEQLSPLAPAAPPPPTPPAPETDTPPSEPPPAKPPAEPPAEPPPVPQAP